MRKLLILFFATSLFSACNNNKDDRRSSRDRDRERDDYRSKDDQKEDDRRNTDYKDDRENPDDRDNRNTDDNRSRDDDRRSSDNITTSDGWPSSERVAFIRECVPAAEKKGLTYSQASDYCECMQKKIERAYPDINDAAKVDMSSPRLQQMVEDCAPRQ